MTRAQPLAGRKILIVEDDYYLATDSECWLRAAGAVVLGPVPDAEAAATILGGQAVDCAVVDINLGTGPSFEVAARLRAVGIPFVLATGYDAAAVPLAYSDVPRLEKPFQEDELIRIVQRITS